MWKLGPEHLGFSSLEPITRIHIVLDMTQNQALGHFLPLLLISFQNLLLASQTSTPLPATPGPFSALGLPTFLAYYDSFILRVQTCRPQKCFWLADKWDGGAQVITPQTF